jgi:hypothetical protein
VTIRVLWSKGTIALRRTLQLYSRLVFRLLTVAIILALGYGVYRNWREVEDYLRGMRFDYVLLALAAHAIALGCTAVAWHLIVRVFSGDARLGRDSRVYYTTTVAKRIPGIVWYIAGRAHLYSETGISKSIVVTCTVMETALAFVAGVASFLLLSPLYSYWLLPANVWLLLILAVPLMGIAFQPAILVRFVNLFLRRFHRAQMSVSASRLSILPICTMYGLAWLGGGFCLYLLISASQPLPVSELPTVIGFATVSGLTGLLALALPAGMGVKEIALAAMLSYYVSFPVAAAVALLFRVLTTADEIIWAVIAAILWK